MQEGSDRRLARNEALFRLTNEAIERGQWGDAPDKPVRFRCECSRMECSDAIEVTLAQYEEVRRFPRRFLVAPGHEVGEIETVVGTGAGYLVVEKVDGAGEIAAATDPRH
jgi:hypothetical protein